MKVIALLPLAAFGALGLTACVTNSNRCVSGYVYSSEYDACLQIDAGADAAASTVPDAGNAPVSDGSPGDDSGEGGGGGSAADLGKSCNAASDCSGLSNYCLKSPADPTAPGYCTIPNCTQPQCGATYSCCTCTAAAVPQLQALPPVCVQPGDKDTLVSFGCTCQ